MHNVQRTTQENNTNNNKGNKTYRKKRTWQKEHKGKISDIGKSKFYPGLDRFFGTMVNRKVICLMNSITV
jgi:hypothetical protein